MQVQISQQAYSNFSPCLFPKRKLLQGLVMELTWSQCKRQPLATLAQGHRLNWKITAGKPIFCSASGEWLCARTFALSTWPGICRVGRWKRTLYYSKHDFSMHSIPSALATHSDQPFRSAYVLRSLESSSEPVSFARNTIKTVKWAFPLTSTHSILNMLKCILSICSKSIIH